MPRGPKQVKETVPPTISPHQAIPLLHQQIQRLEEIMKLHHDDPKVDAWESTTENILTAAFGLPNGELHPNTFNIIKRHARGRLFYVGMTDADRQQDFVKSQQTRKALLEACIEQLETLAPPAAQVAPGQYRFHPEIEKVSGRLFRGGYYREAALNAYIRVIDDVKARSGLNLDGDPLMNRAFGFEKQTPAIQFNSLQTEAERDEQRGFMFLFKGVVGLRNSKAHSNRLFNDPNRAHEYLALASLLMRLLEIATVNRTP
jgi:uncharacterized protein (TIGR02391 family)